MARIKDIIAAILTPEDEAAARQVAAAGQAANILDAEALKSELPWLSSKSDPRAMKDVSGQNVGYRKINLRYGIKQLEEVRIHAQHVHQLLAKLEARGELYYPFAIVASDSALLLSVIDFDIIMAIAREQQSQKDDAMVANNKPAMRTNT